MSTQSQQLLFQASDPPVNISGAAPTHPTLLYIPSRSSPALQSGRCSGAAIPNGILAQQALGLPYPEQCDRLCALLGLMAPSQAAQREFGKQSHLGEHQRLELQPQVRTVLFTFHGNIPCLAGVFPGAVSRAEMAAEQ